MRATTFLKTLSLPFIFLISAVFSVFFPGCKNNIAPPEMTDAEYIQKVVSSGYSISQDDEDNLMSQESADLDDGGAITDNTGGGMTPLDSLSRWGRKVTGVTLSYSINWSGDTLASVNAARTINGIFIIIGWKNGQRDSVTKPYTEVLHRTVVFKRVDRTSYPRLNWRVYSVSMLDGGTTQPQFGSSQVEITKVEVYVSGVLSYTFNGPDFTQNVFVTKRFGGTGIPAVHRNTQLMLKVYTISQQADTDYVAWHWARNTFGFHRIPFDLESQTGSGPYFRVFTKTFNIYNDHPLGVFNGYINASTHKSLYDDSPSEFASDLVGSPYWVLP